jgi:hypothetical protein
VEELVPIMTDDPSSPQDLGRMFDKKFETLLGDELDRAFIDKM